jgi:hypothetical protein
MKRKPWAIIILALLHILAPVGNLILNAQLLGHTLFEHWSYWLSFMPNILLLTYAVLPIIAGIAIFICKRWSYWVYLICLSLIFISNLYGFYTDLSLLKLAFLMMVLIADLLAVAYFLVPAVRIVYFNPKLRWWESVLRYHFSHVIDMNGVVNAGHITNISEDGVFVSSQMALEEQEKIVLSWDFENFDYSIEAKVVYKNVRNNKEGYGMQFIHTAESKKQIRRLCAKLRLSGFAMETSTPGPKDSFLNWVKEIMKNPQGIFPKNGNQR